MKNLIIYKSHWELIEQLSVEQVGNLMKGIAKFCRDEEVNFTDPLLIGIWMMMKRDFIIQAENYEKKKEANRRNGKLGGRPKQTEDNQKNPMGYLETQQTHNNPQNLKEKEKEKDIEKDIEKEKDIDNASSIASCSDASFINKIKRQEDLSEVLDNIFGK
jgi:hypothetical protein